MKYTFTKGLFVAAIATLIAACSTDDTTDQTPVAPGKIEVSLNAAMPASRAQIEIDEINGRFSGSWEATDAMTVFATGGTTGDETPKFTYDAAAKVFKGQLTNTKQDWTYQAVYPAVETEPLKIPFGAVRTQKGNAFNSAYDPLISIPVTHLNSEPGKTPEDEAVTFGMKRLTGILALTFNTDDTAVKNEKVKSVTLTSAAYLAATTLDIDKTSQTHMLSADGRSQSITLNYEEGTEPTAAEFKAYFNLRAAVFGSLTIDITTEGHTASFELLSGSGLAVQNGELYYTTRTVTNWTALTAAPTLEWVDNPTFEKQEIKADMSVLVNLQAAAGIEGFVIKVDSKGLAAVLGGQMGMPTEGNVTTMDMVNNPNTAMIKGMIPGFPDPLAGHKEAFQLTLSTLVPMILGLPELGIGITNEDIVGDHKFTLTMSDVLGKSVEKTLIFYVAAPTTPTAAISGINLWTNEATATLTNAPAEATFQYKRSTETDWKNATKNDNGTFKIAPTWSTQKNAAALDYHTVDRNTGVFAGATYDWQILNGSNVIGSGSFDTNAGNQIPNGDMADGSMTCFTLDNTKATFWASGSFDAGSFIGKYQLCNHETFDGHTTAHLVPGTVFSSVLAAGSLMTGTFEYKSMAGTASFGQNFSYNARPTAMKVKFHATIGDIDKEGNSHPDQLKKNEKDKARIFVCITDWSGRHAVKAGASSVDGAWNPETQTSVTEGDIIGYGSHWITESTTEPGLVEISIPIYYYDNVTLPSKTYTIAISCASSAYGDYKNGSTKSNLYVTDFEWVY